MAMTVGELIARLEEYDEEAEVRFMYQPNYPLMSTVAGVVSDAAYEAGPVYILEGKWLGYGDKAAWANV